MSDQERAAAKRRASFGRAGRLAREAKQKIERETAETQRKEARQKADQQRKADATKAAEQRVAQSRKRAEQQRLQRHKENIRKEFARKAEDRVSQAARAKQQRSDEAVKAAEQVQQTKESRTRQDAEAHVAQQHKRQNAEQLEEHRRQTHRLRVEHQAERAGFRHREGGLVIQHARQIRNIDLAERRDLDALDTRRHSLTGRAINLVRGAKHYERQEQAIVDRHENTRWHKHREHEGKKDALFYTEQASRLRQVGERRDIALRHQTERGELAQAQERSRPQLIEARVQALRHANQNQPTRQKAQAHLRAAGAFNKAAERGLEIKR